MQFSVERSGSTWQFNAIKQILDCKGVSYDSFFLTEDDIALRSRTLNNFDFNLVKSHFLEKEEEIIKAMISYGQIMILATKRDIRKIISSYQRFINKEADLEYINNLVGLYMNTINNLNDYPIHITHEDEFSDHNSVLAISDYIGLPISEAEAREITESLSKDSVRSKIDTIFGAEEDIHIFDEDTHWHPKHISDTEQAYVGSLKRYKKLLKYQEWGNK